jgi:transcriptional regulator GlxA family with amidase domain
MIGESLMNIKPAVGHDADRPASPTVSGAARAQYGSLTAGAIEAIRDGFALLSGVDELACALGVSKCHLIRVFKQDTGLSPGRYLGLVRIGAARLLLESRTYSVEAVANMVGYSGANYFCKVFKQAVGESPAAYRALGGGRTPVGEADAQWLRRLEAQAQV